MFGPSDVTPGATVDGANRNILAQNTPAGWNKFDGLYHTGGPYDDHGFPPR